MLAAVRDGNEANVRLALTLGAQPDYKSLKLCCALDNADCLRLLVPTTHAALLDSELVITAIEYGAHECLSVLVAAGADIGGTALTVDRCALVPLEFAVLVPKDERTVRMLMQSDVPMPAAQDLVYHEMREHHMSMFHTLLSNLPLFTPAHHLPLRSVHVLQMLDARLKHDDSVNRASRTPPRACVRRPRYAKVDEETRMIRAFARNDTFDMQSLEWTRDEASAFVIELNI